MLWRVKWQKQREGREEFLSVFVYFMLLKLHNCIATSSCIRSKGIQKRLPKLRKKLKPCLERDKIKS